MKREGKKVNRKLARVFLIIFLSILSSSYLYSAPLYFEPVEVTLPDGTTLNLFVSGDEFFNWMHDKEGFPVAVGSDGYYYYQIQDLSTFRSSGIKSR